MLGWLFQAETWMGLSLALLALTLIWACLAAISARLKAEIDRHELAVRLRERQLGLTPSNTRSPK